MSFESNIIDVGADANMGGQHMYRQWIGKQEQILIFDVDGITINTTLSEFRIWYKQYYLADDDTEVGLQNKFYVIKDIPGFPNLTTRLTQLWRTPIDDAAPGIASSIEAVLAALPFEVPNGYILNS